MAVTIKTFKVDPDGGDVFIELRALRALPIEGVISSFTRESVETQNDAEPSVTTFRIPPETKRYVLYGVVTPIRKLWRAPKYERIIRQGHELATSKAANPATFSTRKINAGEWVGAPEVISIDAS